MYSINLHNGYIIILFSLSLALTNNCVLYSRVDPQCSSAHSLCHYVQPYEDLTLETTEKLLITVFSDINIAVENGTLTQSCAEAFSLIYCHQVYERCTIASNGTEYTPLDTNYLCKSECYDLISECESDWQFLTELLEDSPHLPSLIRNCSTDRYSAVVNECIPHSAGMVGTESHG